MAGPSPESRRPPKSERHGTASGGESAGRGARPSAADPAPSPKPGGMRSEVKLALLLIITLGCAFGYLVHRKFDALRREVSAAEGPGVEGFRPLASLGKGPAEVNLPADGAPTELPGKTVPSAGKTSVAAPAPPLLEWSSGDLPPRTLTAAPGTDVRTPVADPFPVEAQQESPERPFLPEEAGSAARAPSAGETPLFPETVASSTPRGAAPPEQGEPASSPEHHEPAPFAPAATPAANTERELFSLFGDDVPSTPRPQTVNAPPVSGEPPFQAETPVAAATRSPEAMSPPATPPDHNAKALFPETPATTRTAAEFPAAVPSSDPFLTPQATEPQTASTPSPVPVGGPPTAPAASAEVPFQPEPFVSAPAAERVPTPASTTPPPFASPPAARPQESQPSAFPAESRPSPAAGREAAPGFPEEPLFTPASAPSPTPHRLQEPIETTAVGSPLPGASAAPATVTPATSPAAGERLPFPASNDRFVTSTPGGTSSPPVTATQEPFAPARPPADDLFGPAPHAAPAGASSASQTARAPATPLPQPAFSSAADRVYTVRPGDTYWTIAKVYFDSGRYSAPLAAYNRDQTPTPERLRPGMQLVIPAREILEAQFPELLRDTAAASPGAAIHGFAPSAPAPTSAPAGQFLVSAQGEPMYRVGTGDTLTSIAQRHLGRASRWEQIAELNKDVLPRPDRLKVGLILRLPPDASHVPVTPEGPADR